MIEYAVWLSQNPKEEHLISKILEGQKQKTLTEQWEIKNGVSEIGPLSHIKGYLEFEKFVAFYESLFNQDDH